MRVSFKYILSTTALIVYILFGHLVECKDAVNTLVTPLCTTFALMFTDKIGSMLDDTTRNTGSIIKQYIRKTYIIFDIGALCTLYHVKNILNNNIHYGFGAIDVMYLVCLGIVIYITDKKGNSNE